jgi:hypothetical protein
MHATATSRNGILLPISGQLIVILGIHLFTYLSYGHLGLGEVFIAANRLRSDSNYP